MLDIKLVRNNPELVKENIRKKFQDEKLAMVDEVVAMDKEWREDHTRGDVLRNQRNVLSKQIGGMMARGERDKAEETKKEVKAMQDAMAALEAREAGLEPEIRYRTSLIRLFLSARTTARTLSANASANPLCRITKYPTMWT